MKSFKNFVAEDIAKLRSGKYVLLSPDGAIMGVFDNRHDAVIRQQELNRINHEKEFKKEESEDGSNMVDCRDSETDKLT